MQRIARSARSPFILCLGLALSACPTTGPTRQPPDDGRSEAPDDAPDGDENGVSDAGGDAGNADGGGDDGGRESTAPGPSLPDGRLCDTSADCPEGQICEGPGCGPQQGRCVVSERICTRDLAQYCDCEGVTFTGSGSCPGARYAYRGPCGPALEDGEPCTDGRQCRSGQCLGEGLEGCTNGAQGVCGRTKCTTDEATYCGCNNTEFGASGTCPNRQFAYRGPCEGG